MDNEGEVDFEVPLRVRYNERWVPGNFEWDIAPHCSCGWLAKAFEAEALFVRDWVYEGNKYHVQAYLLTADGEMLGEAGVQFRFCPMCADEIVVSKKQDVDG